MKRILGFLVACLLGFPAYADTLTNNLELNQQTIGGNINTWGTILNNNFGTIDSKFGDTTTINATGGTYVLSDTEEWAQIIEVTGTLTSNLSVEFSARGGFWIIDNQTTGSYTVTVLVNGQTGVEVTQGERVMVYSDGTDIEVAQTPATVDDWTSTTLASSATTDVLGQTEDYVEVTGTTTITSLGSTPLVRKMIEFDDALTLTYNATSLILPTNANITTAAGDLAVVISDASGNARIVDYQRDDGTPLALGTDQITTANITDGSVTIGKLDSGVYETGTWTPVFEVNNDTTGVAYSSRVGRYVAIGNLVIAYCTIVLTNDGTASGNITISGLPYASSNISDLNYIENTFFTDIWNDDAYGVWVSLSPNTSEMDVLLRFTNHEGSWGWGTLDDDDTQNDFSINFTLVYRSG